MSMSKSQFRATAAKFVTVQVDGQTVHVPVKEFSTGSLGYYHSGKLTIAGVQYQVGITLTAVKSKEWPESNGQVTSPAAKPATDDGGAA